MNQMEGNHNSIEELVQQEQSNRFEKFKEDFFSSLVKLNKMQDIAQLMQNECKQGEQSKLAQNIVENTRFVEESAYAKLVRHLKEKIKVFDSPLENQPEFLIFLKVTLKMLKNRSGEMYSHIMNELIKQRGKYIELLFNEKLSLIYTSVSKSEAEHI